MKSFTDDSLMFGKKAALSLRRLSGENLLFTLFRAPRRLFDSEKARE